MRDQREHVYDTEMAPLVDRLIEIAKREGIPLFLCAGMVGQTGPVIACTIVGGRSLPTVDHRFRLAMGVVRGHDGFERAEGLVISRMSRGPRYVGCVVLDCPNVDDVSQETGLCAGCAREMAT